VRDLEGHVVAALAVVGLISRLTTHKKARFIKLIVDGATRVSGQTR
jgi:DNA-binding IclR family transcriptional regulator